MSEREPRPGTKRAQVWELLSQGKSGAEIKGLTGFSSRELSQIKVDLRSRGHLKQSDEERLRARRREVSLGGGGVWTSSEPYAEMGMFTGEIVAALSLRGVEKYSSLQIERSVSHARNRGFLPKLTSEERREVNRDAHRSKEVIRERVCLWLDVRSSLEQKKGLEWVPIGRNEWLLLCELLLTRREKMNGNGEALNAFDRKLNAIVPDVLERLKPCFVRILDETPTTPQISVPPDSMAMPSEVTPGERMFAEGPVRTFH